MKHIVVCLLLASSSVIYGLTVNDIKKKIQTAVASANKVNYAPTAFIAWQKDAYAQLAALHQKSAPSAMNITGSLNNATKKQLAQLLTKVQQGQLAADALASLAGGLSDTLKLIRGMSWLSAADVVAAQKRLIAAVNTAILTSGQSGTQTIDKRKKLLDQELIYIERAEKNNAQPVDIVTQWEKSIQAKNKKIQEQEEVVAYEAQQVQEQVDATKKFADNMDDALEQVERQLQKERLVAIDADNKKKEQDVLVQIDELESVESDVDKNIAVIDAEQKQYQKQLEQQKKELNKRKTFREDAVLSLKKEQAALQETIKNAEEAQKKILASHRDRIRQEITRFKSHTTESKNAFNAIIDEMNTIVKFAQKTVQELDFESKDVTIQQASYGFNMMNIREIFEEVGQLFLDALRTISVSDQDQYISTYIQQRADMYLDLAILPYEYVNALFTWMNRYFMFKVNIDAAHPLSQDEFKALYNMVIRITDNKIPELMNKVSLVDVILRDLYILEDMSYVTNHQRDTKVVDAQDNMERTVTTFAHTYIEQLLEPLAKIIDTVTDKNMPRNQHDIFVFLYNRLIKRCVYTYKLFSGYNEIPTLRVPKGLTSLIEFYAPAIEQALKKDEKKAEKLADRLFRKFTDEYTRLNNELNQVSFDGYSFNFKNNKLFPKFSSLQRSVIALDTWLNAVYNDSIEKKGHMIVSTFFTIQISWVKKYIDQAFAMIKINAVNNVAYTNKTNVQSVAALFDKKGGVNIMLLPISLTLVTKTMNELLLHMQKNLSVLSKYAEYMKKADANIIIAMQKSTDALIAYIKTNYLEKIARAQIVDMPIAVFNDTIDAINRFIKKQNKRFGFTIDLMSLDSNI